MHWLVLASYGTILRFPFRSCNMRPFIGMPCWRRASSRPTSASALRPRADSAKLILRPMTSSAVRMSAKCRKHEGLVNAMNGWMTNATNWRKCFTERMFKYLLCTHTGPQCVLFCRGGVQIESQPWKQNVRTILDFLCRYQWREKWVGQKGYVLRTKNAE